jgi:hypothetical protein
VDGKGYGVWGGLVGWVDVLVIMCFVEIFWFKFFVVFFWGLGFGVWGLGFGVWVLGFGVWGFGFWFC